MSERRSDQAWVFWDGTCGFCRRAVDWIKRQDRHDRLFPVPYQVAPRPPMTEALARRCAHAIHVLTPEGVVLSAGRASLYLMDAVGWRRFSAVFSTRPLIWLVEAAYRVVAGRRQWFSRFLFRPERLENQVGDDVRLERLKRSEEHTSELQSRSDLVCRLLLEKKKKKQIQKAHQRDKDVQ